MPLIVFPHTVPMDERTHLSDCLNMFVNVGREDLVDDWAAEQPFAVYRYKGWWNTFYFDETSHFILLKIQVPQPDYILYKPRSEKFMPFYEQWRQQYDEKQEAFKEKIRLERIDKLAQQKDNS